MLFALMCPWLMSLDNVSKYIQECGETGLESTHGGGRERHQGEERKEKWMIRLVLLLLCRPRKTADLTLHSRTLIYLMISE